MSVTGESGLNIKVLLWVFVFLSVLLWSAIEPADRLTWWMEVIPAIAGFAILLFTRKRFPLTELLYTLILIHAVILMIGGHYTYAEVPIGDWLRDLSEDCARCPECGASCKPSPQASCSATSSPDK